MPKRGFLESLPEYQIPQQTVKAVGNHREGRGSSTILQRWTDLNSVAPAEEPNVKQKTKQLLI